MEKIAFFPLGGHPPSSRNNGREMNLMEICNRLTALEETVRRRDAVIRRRDATIRDLQRQIVTLRREVEQKDATIARLTRGRRNRGKQVL